SSLVVCHVAACISIRTATYACCSVVCVTLFFLFCSGPPRDLPSFPTRRSSDLPASQTPHAWPRPGRSRTGSSWRAARTSSASSRSEEHTSELQSRFDLVCRLLLEKKNNLQNTWSEALAVRK